MKKKKEVKEKKPFKKLIIIISLILFVLLSSSASYLYYFYTKHKFTFKLKDSVTLPLGSKVDPEDYIKKIKNAKVKYNNVETDTIGEKVITYTVTDYLFKKKHKYTYKLNIIDDIAPTISGKDKVSLYIDSKIDLNSYIKVSDN